MNSIYVGVLSGTSMDAIDAAAFCFDQQYAPIAQHRAALADDVRRLIKKAQTHALPLASLARLDYELGLLFAEAVTALLAAHPQLDKQRIRAVGLLGQTIAHEPNQQPAFTWQVGDANIVAKKTGLLTVADFRRADLALGGQGAPLASGFHRLVFERRGQRTAVVNIGGIANISLLPGDGSVSSFDCGPGNCLMDAWIQKHQQRAYDHNGQWAQASSANKKLVAQLASHPFIARQAPKSACVRHFSLQWLASCLQKCPPMPAVEVQASLLDFTAACIAQSMRAWLTAKQDMGIHIVLCGGGAYNRHLVHVIQQKTQLPVQLSDALGMPAQWVETAVCAWLAQQRLEMQPVSTAQTTGIQTPAVLGAIYC